MSQLVGIQDWLRCRSPVSGTIRSTGDKQLPSYWLLLKKPSPARWQDRLRFNVGRVPSRRVPTLLGPVRWMRSSPNYSSKATLLATVPPLRQQVACHRAHDTTLLTARIVRLAA